MLSRRHLLKMIAMLPFTGGLAIVGPMQKVSDERMKRSYQTRDYFKELGIRRIINGRGAVTTLTGSLMPPEVREAWNYASHDFVDLNELNKKVGERIAVMLNCEAAMVTAGAASAMTLGTAAAITGEDNDLIRDLPNIPGPRREVIMQKSHRYNYDHAVRNTGVKIIEVDSKRDMERKINENTVLAFFFNRARKEHIISQEEFVRIGKKHNVPTFNDCAAEVPPVENLFKYIEMGFDMVTFSGGKGLCGPQSAGLLFGRKDLIEAAKMNHSPNGNSIGRGMKVNKEEILGMMVALEVYLKKDHEKQFEQWKRWAERIASVVRSVPGVTTEVSVPTFGKIVPRLIITWDEAMVNISPLKVKQKLSSGDPSIIVGGDQEEIIYDMFMIQSHEVNIVADRTKAILEEGI